MAKPIDLEGIKERLHRCDVRELEDYIYFLCDEIDRLRSVNYYNESAIAGARSLLAPIPGDDGEKQTPQGKTVRAEIKVAVDYTGSVDVGEDNFQWILRPRAYYTLTADLPVPKEVEVKAEVEDEN